MQIVLQASRALTYNLASVAKHVKRDLPDLGNHISIDEDGSVYLNNPSAFYKAMQNIAVAQTRTEENQNNENRSRPKGGRGAQLNRWSQLWSPFGRRSVNVAILREDGTIAETANDKATELRKFWGGVFAEKTISVKEAEEFLRQYAVKLDIAENSIPTTASIKKDPRGS